MVKKPKTVIISICNLCNEYKTLCGAHIIPQAFVKSKVKEYYGRNLIEVEKDKSGKEILSNGYYDKNILCEKCDRKLGAYEDKLISFLRDSNNTNKYDYRSVSLAIKGILWKAHITTLSEFKQIDLGKYGDKLYDSLKDSLNELDSILPQDFPIWIGRYINKGNSKNDTLSNMINCGSKGRDNKYHSILYRFDFIGHQVVIKVGGSTLPENINQFITKDKANISEIPYTFDGAVEEIFNPNPRIIQAFYQVSLN